MPEDELKLGMGLQRETVNAIGRTYREIGSITRCKNINDFGKYRRRLVYELDQEIKKIKSKQ